MEECRAAGDFPSYQIDNQASSSEEEKTRMDQNHLKDCGLAVDKSANYFTAVSERADLTSAVDTGSGNGNVLDSPVFDLDCPCDPQCKCKTFMSDTDTLVSDFFCSDTDTVNASNFSKENKTEETNCNSEHHHLHDDHFKMDCESTVDGLQGKDQTCSEWQRLLFNEENKSLHDQEDKDRNESLINGVDDSSSPHFDSLRLDELDDDAIFHIASLMEARSINYGLSQSCQRFQAMFDNDAYWKTRLNMKWSKRYPAVPESDDFCWEDACIASEDCQRMWSDPDAHTHHFMYSCNVNGEVDAVHLMQNGKLLLSGDRNRNLNVIDLTKYNSDFGVPSMSQMTDMLVLSNSMIHKGWIWSITSVDNHVMTGSWDTKIRVFDLNSDIQNFSTYKCKSAVLSLYAEDKEIVASCFDKKVYFFDQRSSKSTSCLFHRQAVMSVAGNEDYIISGSEDKTICIYNRRAGKISKTIKLDAYPLCLSFQHNQLWFGDKSGLIHLYDASAGRFNHVGTYDVGHKDKVTGIIYTPGSIFTCSGDKTLKVLTPTRDPEEITSRIVNNKELAKIDYSCGVLASAGGDESIGVWLPKHWGKDTYLL